MSDQSGGCKTDIEGFKYADESGDAKGIEDCKAGAGCREEQGYKISKGSI